MATALIFAGRFRASSCVRAVRPHSAALSAQCGTSVRITTTGQLCGQVNQRSLIFRLILSRVHDGAPTGCCTAASGDAPARSRASMWVCCAKGRAFARQRGPPGLLGSSTSLKAPEVFCSYVGCVVRQGDLQGSRISRSGHLRHARHATARIMLFVIAADFCMSFLSCRL